MEKVPDRLRDKLGIAIGLQVYKAGISSSAVRLVGTYWSVRPSEKRTRGIPPSFGIFATYRISRLIDTMWRAYFSQYPEHGLAGELKVRAACDLEGMHWLVVYDSETDPKTSFMRDSPQGQLNAPSTGTIGDIVAGVVVGTAKLMSSNLPSVPAQLMLDNQYSD